MVDKATSLDELPMRRSVRERPGTDKIHQQLEGISHHNACAEESLAASSEGAGALQLCESPTSEVIAVDSSGSDDNGDEQKGQELPGGRIHENSGSQADASGNSTLPHDGAAGTPASALLMLMQTVQKRVQETNRELTMERFTAWQESRTREDNSQRENMSKKRKPTHTVRREEISELSDEIRRLESRLVFLRGETIAASTSSTRTGDGDDGDVVHPQMPNALLRDAIQGQQLRLARARSLMSEFAANDLSLPAHCYIHLTKSAVDRERTMQAVKIQQLRLARQFALERSHHLNLATPYAAGEKFVKANGDACNIRFSIVQFPGSLSVRQVFDVALFFTANLEISFTDGAGHVTICENTADADDPTMSQHRFLTTVSPELLVEGNLVLFTHFDDDEDYGIVTTTFVDRDDLHPYRTSERVRQDVTAIMLITREQDLVVVRRLGHTRLHQNGHAAATNDALLALSDGASRWGDALMDYARDTYGV